MKKSNDTDSYSEFLKKRKKVVDQMTKAGGNEELDGKSASALMAENGELSWSSGEDIVFLNALKAF